MLNPKLNPKELEELTFEGELTLPKRKFEYHRLRKGDVITLVMKLSDGEQHCEAVVTKVEAVKTTHSGHSDGLG